MTKVKDVMTSEPATIGPDDGCAQAAMIMREEDCGSLPVVRDGVLVGIVTDRDIVIRAAAGGRDLVTTKVSEVMSADPITIGPEADIDDAAKLMAERQVRRLPVVDKGHLVGIIVTAQLARREKEAQTGKTIKQISEPASGRASHGRG